MQQPGPEGRPADRGRERSWTGRVRSAFTPTRTDASALERDLRAALDCPVDFGAGARALYSTDASNYRQVPIGVVVPRTIEDVVRTVEIARRHDAPITPRGGGTGLAGQTTNTAVILDFSRYLDGILWLDPEKRLARVEPGCILDTLRDAASTHGLTFGPDPATHSHNTLGGMIGNNSGGVHSVMAGLTVENVESLDVLTYDGIRMEVGPTDPETLRRIIEEGGRRGEIYAKIRDLIDREADHIRQVFPHLRRRVSGYCNLDWLLPERGFHLARALVGTEATCVVVLGATLRLVPDPAHKVTVLLGFPDVYQAADAVPKVLEHGPVACEGLDRKLINNLKTKNLHLDKLEILPDGNGWLVVEMPGQTEEEAEAGAKRLRDAFSGNDVNVRLVESAKKRHEIRTLRESGLGATAYVPGEDETWEGWEDTAVPRDKLGKYLREFRALLDRYGYDTVMYGHFGDGLVHCRINFDLDSEEGIKHWRAFLEEGARLVARFGGSLSGEHGDGQARAMLLDTMYGAPMVEVFRAFKAIWDPWNRMNPGKVIDPYPITSNLREGPLRPEPKIRTAFAYKEDGGSFARAVNRCVGVGKCRRLDSDGEVMCPSFMATRDEQHSTRGRSRLLYEMLRNDPIRDGFRSAAVEEALDLCFACKGCKNDCPVSVDMATYKAEFRYRHYARRLRPRPAYSTGMIYWWARLASRMPRLANGVAHAPGLGALAKGAAGIARERSLPRFAPETFAQWFARRGARGAGERRVVLWPDTFNNHFHPETAKAALAVLERAGHTVVLPPRPLCCARPLYDWGMLDLARRLLRQILDSLEDEIAAGTPVIGLEPACTSALRDELPALFPDDERAARLAEQTQFFSDFVLEQGDGLRWRPRNQEAVVQIHCHQHAVLDPDAEWHLLDRLGVEVAARPGGCCGMAGSLGFEEAKQDVSAAAARRALVPALEGCDGLVIANGFSCREQIRHFSGRRAEHIAEIAAASLPPSG